ncbi:unnamed protein product, partial [Hapterophycus canaliculatus]
MNTLQEIFSAACSRGEDETVRNLLLNNVSAIDFEAVRPSTGRTPLLEACWEGHTTLAEILVASGANVHAQDEVEFACLHAAAYHGHVEIIDLLLDA